MTRRVGLLLCALGSAALALTVTACARSGKADVDRDVDLAEVAVETVEVKAADIAEAVEVVGSLAPSSSRS